MRRRRGDQGRIGGESATKEKEISCTVGSSSSSRRSRGGYPQIEAEMVDV